MTENKTITTEDVVAVANGNPGCLVYLMKAYEQNKQAFLLIMDNAMKLEIKGSDLYVLFKDACKDNIEFAATLLHLTGRGVIDRTELDQIIENAQNRIAITSEREVELMELGYEDLMTLINERDAPAEKSDVG